MDQFVNLHVHSMKGSLLDSILPIPSLFQKVKEFEQSAVAITDHGMMSGMVDAAQTAQKTGIKFIPGLEAYWVPDATIKSKDVEKGDDTDDVSRKHLILWAKDNEGYKRLMKICSWGCVEGYYYRPRIDDSVLEKYGTEGLMASSACVVGLIAQYLLKGNYEAAKQKALYYQQLFNGEFYLELMPHEGVQVEVNKGLIQLHNDINIPLIITSDAHYLNKEDAEAHDMLLCIQTRSAFDDPNRWRFSPGSYYIMNRQEILNVFKEKHSYIDSELLEEAADNTVKIAEKSNVEFNFKKHYLPRVDPYTELESDPQLKKEFDLFESRRLMEIAKRENVDIEQASCYVDPANEYIKFLCIHGWHGLYKQNIVDARHLSLMLYELDVIIGMGMSSYFLIMYEIMHWCEFGTGDKFENKIARAAARGCFCPDNTVQLENSVKNINDVVIGDKILGLDNQYHSVTNVYEYDCAEILLNVQVEDGRMLKGVTKDHKVFGIKDNVINWYKIDELNVGDYIFSIC